MLPVKFLDGYLQANVGKLKKCKYSSAKLNGTKGAVLRSDPTIPSAGPLSGSLVSGPLEDFPLHVTNWHCSFQMFTVKLLFKVVIWPLLFTFSQLNHFKVLLF